MEQKRDKTVKEERQELFRFLKAFAAAGAVIILFIYFFGLGYFIFKMNDDINTLKQVMYNHKISIEKLDKFIGQRFNSNKPKFKKKEEIKKEKEKKK